MVLNGNEASRGRGNKLAIAKLWGRKEIQVKGGNTGISQGKRLEGEGKEKDNSAASGHITVALI